MAYLEQLKELYARLTGRQRAAIALAAMAVVAGLVFFLRWQQERNFKPLFQNLSGEDAGMVMNRLKESGVEVRLADGGSTIKVPSDKIDELRIQMASAGLPKTGRIGYELFDKANFGTSEFAEQVNYHRAIEGELERSVMALQEVEQARVHITLPRQSLFMENRQPAKASVMVKLRLGAKLSQQNIQAIAHLTSSAVEGLQPEQVSVLDMRGNLLSRPRRNDPNAEQPSEELIEYRQRMERDYMQKIQATLEPLVGPERFRAAVSIDCDMASGDQSEESFDPARSVMATSQRTEDGAGAPSANGTPGTASNLPRPSSRTGTGAGSQTWRRTENTTFQTSRVVRHIKFPQGQVKRVSVSVLLDHTVRTEGAGKNVKQIVEPPAPERVRAIKDLVAAVVGYQQERGDQLIVEALPFESTMQIASPAPPAAAGPPAGEPKLPRLQLPQAIPDWLRVPMEGHLNWLVNQAWFLALALALVGGLVYGLVKLLRAIGRKVLGLRKPKKGTHVDVTLGGAIEEGAGVAGELEAGEESRLTPEQQIKRLEEEQERLRKAAIETLQIPEATMRKGEALINHLTGLAVKDPSSMAQLLRAWLKESEG
jgi:flagellar M-ring protein FliF